MNKTNAAEPHCKCAKLCNIYSLISSISKNDSCYYFSHYGNFCSFRWKKNPEKRLLVGVNFGWYCKNIAGISVVRWFFLVWWYAIKGFGRFRYLLNSSIIIRIAWLYIFFFLHFQAVYDSHIQHVTAWSNRLLLVFLFQLVCKRKFGGLFLQFCKFVFVFWDLFERGFDELALHVTDWHVQLIDLEIS